MTPALAEKMGRSEIAFSGSLDSIDAVQELERRRELVREGHSNLVPEERSWEFLKASGRHV